MLNVVNKSIMLNVLMLIVIMLNVVMQSVMAPDKRSQFRVKMTESRLIITGPGLVPIFVER